MNFIVRINAHILQVIILQICIAFVINLQYFSSWHAMFFFLPLDQNNLESSIIFSIFTRVQRMH